MKNVLSNIKYLPEKTKYLLVFGTIIALVVALPIFIWGIATQNLEIRKKAQVATIEVGSYPTLGPLNAPITIVEFGDYQCEFCQAFAQDTFASLMAAYPDQIRFAFRDFPLSDIHPDATAAAMAAACANEQNMFWEMHDLLFQNQNDLSVTNLKALAAGLNLNTAVFNECLDTNKYADAITADKTAGTGYGVTGTPTFFINGTMLQGNQPLSAFQTIIDQQLATPTPTNSPTPTPTATPDLTPTPTPTVPPTGGKQVMQFKVKLTGVTENAAEGAKVVIRFLTGDNSINHTTPPLTLTHTGWSVYETTMVLNDNFLPNRDDYAILVKGEKHLARKFCQQSGQASPCTGNGRISVPNPNDSGTWVYDFTGLTLDPGDLYIQDGKADMNDFNKVLGLMAKTCSSLSDQDKLTADLDYSGCVNVKDAFLMRKTLETRYDEN